MSQKKLPSCAHCQSGLRDDENGALFVEEEVGRVFCSESCIVSYFSPDIDRFERLYYENLSKDDLKEEERARLANLRWKTLELPHEIWREKTLGGDHRYTLIREFDYEGAPVWSVCVSFFLRGEPSFLFIALVTRDIQLVELFRKGERVQWLSPGSEVSHAQQIEEVRLEAGDADLDETEEEWDELSESEAEELPAPLDCLAEPFTEEETYRAQLNTMRTGEDISPSDFPNYDACMEETLQVPDEVWSCLLYTSPSPRDRTRSRMPSSA